MPMMHHSNEEESERRYDPETLRKVTALAARLQSERQEYLTASEMESIGAEVGLEAEFIRQALAQHTEQVAQAEKEALEEREQETRQSQSLHTAHSLQIQPVQQVVETRSTKTEFLAAVLSLTLPIVWGTLAYMFRFSSGFMTLFTLISPAPLTALLGFLSGRKSVGMTTAMMMVMALAPTFPYLFYSQLTREQIDPGMYYGAMFAYALFATPMIASLGALGASLRERFFPLGMERQARKNVSRSDMLHTMQALQTQMEGRRQHRACLSVDVVGPTEMRFGHPAPLVDYTFGQYRRWVDEVARACGGELHSGMGDSMLFLFPTDAQAVRVARRLQEGVTSFNAALNRLPMPFRLRCGVSGGELMEGANPALPHLQHLHSPMLDRAAMLQHRAEPGDVVVSGEVAASALVELEHLAPLPDPVYGAPAFSWQAGQRLRSAIN